MYRMHRWFRVANAKGRDTRAYLSEVRSLLTESYDRHCGVFVEVFGPKHLSAHIMIDFADMTDFETFWLSLGGDETFGELHSREFDLAIEGSFGQALLHSAE